VKPSTLTSNKPSAYKRRARLDRFQVESDKLHCGAGYAGEIFSITRR
jgi:hypothetical protein